MGYFDCYKLYRRPVRRHHLQSPKVHAYQSFTVPQGLNQTQTALLQELYNLIQFWVPKKGTDDWPNDPSSGHSFVMLL